MRKSNRPYGAAAAARRFAIATPCFGGELPPVAATLKGRFHLLIPIIALVTMLLLAYSPMKAAFWSIALLFVLGLFHRATRMGPRRLLGKATAISPLLTVVGVPGETAATQGFLFRPLRKGWRPVFLLAGLLLVKPGTVTGFIGVGLGIVSFFLGRVPGARAAVLAARTDAAE